ncbi:dihydropteroate synthase [Weissella oryzae SG25]|uniref:Dihydropteroate synthase n=1 Tax=Weissella oryzae (strain DSM 25784 / JCM 18191 / LMG 30913 / SG25) TaxID=1329250 RepID=A0A069CZU2_WEIOS|nr:dihydropteroate synthase [Weissella oryzae]GAK30621.1 dihydropteroate synthase [Weissella oryzae SG25]
MEIVALNPKSKALTNVGLIFKGIDEDTVVEIRRILAGNIQINWLKPDELLVSLSVFELRHLINHWAQGNAKAQLAAILAERQVIWAGKRFKFDLTFKPIVYAIVNITPDSFYDGNPNNLTLDYVLDRVAKDLAAGADVIEFGGKSSRPGYEDISPAAEWARLEQPLAAVRARFPEAVIAIDTDEPYVMEQALLAGADIINDIDGFDTAEKMALLAKYRPAVVIMNNGRAGFEYADNVYEELPSFFAAKQAALLAQGLTNEQLCIDAGVGFFDQRNGMDSVERVKATEVLTQQGLPVMLAISHKSFMSKVFAVPEEQRLTSSLVFEAKMLEAGGRVIRVHDTKATRLLIDGYIKYQEY